jgi:hypothetical protein
MCHVQLQQGGMRATGAKGFVQGIRYCPRLIGSCLDLASPTRGRILAAFTAACLQTHLASRQEKRVIIIIIIIRYCGLPEQLPSYFDNMPRFRGGVVLIEVKSFRVTDHRERMLDGSASQLELCVSVSHARPNPFQDEQLMYRLLI